MELTPKQKRKLEKIARVIDEGELAIAEHILELEDKFESTVEQIKKEVPDLDKILASIRGEDGDDYVLTDEDIKSIADEATKNINFDDVVSKTAAKVPVEEIAQRVADKAAQKIKVPVVEKVIEKTEVIREVPQEIDVNEVVNDNLAPKLTEQEERIKKAIKEYTDELFDIFKEDNTQAQNGYTDEVKTLQNRTQLLLQIATQRTNTTSTGSSPSTDAWNLTGNSGTTAGTNFTGTTDDEAYVIKTNGIERLRVQSFGASDITQIDLGTSSTTSARLYFRDGTTEYYRINIDKSGSNMTVDQGIESGGTSTHLINVVGTTAGYFDVNTTTATRILSGKPVRFMNSTNYVGLKTSSTTPDDTDYCLPATDAVRSGNAVTSNQSGVLSFDYFLRSMGSNTSDSSAVANTTSETLFDIVHTIPTADINEVGRTYLVFASGRHSTSGVPSLEIRLKGGVSSNDTLWDSGALVAGSGVTDRPWMFIWVVTTRATGATGQLHSAPLQARIDARNPNNAKNNATVDLTFPCEFGISAQWSAASASNTATLDTFLVIDVNKR